MQKLNAVRLAADLSTAIIGYSELREALVSAYQKRMLGLPRSHVLVFGPPGVGKTYATKKFQSTVARLAGSPVGYERIQGRADLMPEEFLAERRTAYGEDGRPFFAYELGAVGKLKATNGGLPGFLQFDELDRTPPRAQSGMLEAMEEQQLSLPDGQRIPLSFVLIATANTRRFDPACQPIPRAVQDRFGSVVLVDYLPLEGDLEVLKMHQRNWKQLSVRTCDQLLTGMVKMVKLTQRKLDSYTDFASLVKVPAGPRGFLDLYCEAAMHAMCEGRSHLTVADIRAVACRVLRGRIEVKVEAEMKGKPVEILIGDIIEEVFGSMRLPPPPPEPEADEDSDSSEPSEDKSEDGDKNSSDGESDEGEESAEGSDKGSEGDSEESSNDSDSSESGDSGEAGEESEEGKSGEQGEQPSQSGSKPSAQSGQAGSKSQSGQGNGKPSQSGGQPSNGSGSGLPQPQTKPTGGQGQRPTSFLSGLRGEMRQEAGNGSGRPFAQSPQSGRDAGQPDKTPEGDKVKEPAGDSQSPSKGDAATSKKSDQTGDSKSGKAADINTDDGETEPEAQPKVKSVVDTAALARMLAEKYASKMFNTPEGQKTGAELARELANRPDARLDIQAQDGSLDAKVRGQRSVTEGKPEAIQRAVEIQREQTERGSGTGQGGGGLASKVNSLADELSQLGASALSQEVQDAIPLLREVGEGGVVEVLQRWVDAPAKSRVRGGREHRLLKGVAHVSAAKATQQFEDVRDAQETMARHGERTDFIVGYNPQARLNAVRTLNRAAANGGIIESSTEVREKRVTTDAPHLVFVLDASGSMQQGNRLLAAMASATALAGYYGPRGGTFGYLELTGENPFMRVMPGEPDVERVVEAIVGLEPMSGTAYAPALEAAIRTAFPKSTVMVFGDFEDSGLLSDEARALKHEKELRIVGITDVSGCFDYAASLCDDVHLVDMSDPSQVALVALKAAE